MESWKIASNPLSLLWKDETRRKKRDSEGESFPLRRWPRLKRPGEREREREREMDLVLFDDTDTRRIEIITGQIGIVRMHCCYAYTCVTCESPLLLEHRGRILRSSSCSFLAHYPRDYSHDLSHSFSSLESSISTLCNVRCHCHGKHLDSIFSHLYSIG